ncbi:MAG: helix-turn-helix domain-containing protein [Oscillospiraceae bacterium]|nr:helix-turn-helix domain-containing protein [Oscillospiraceae bacterium]
MDQVKIGALIRQLRTERHLTQKQVAERIHVSDKAVSKWERGHGCPDISLLTALADVFDIGIEALLSGKLTKQESEKGNMKKLNFYVCPACGNSMTASAGAGITCCGKRLHALEPKMAAPPQQLKVEDFGGEWFISSDHPMTKEDYISFVAYSNDSTLMLFKQYPEWNLQVTLPLQRAGRLYWYSTSCGLLYQDIRPQRCTAT